MANKHIKGCSTSLIIRDTQIKTTLKHPLIPIRWSLSKGQKITSAGKDVENLDLLCTVGRNVKQCIHCGKQYGGSSKK